ncbi:MAG: ATP-dependent metallopeptidase FtsH/Yme1/Tma family protein, partial [Ktedonobacterales bacterium]|nr:ATP-dependent metallopeptidase FtsH/Yme1/Tma family protein [Ktedonobacterales bacterium]
MSDQGPQRPTGGQRPPTNGATDGSTPPRNSGSSWLVRLSLLALVIFLGYEIVQIYTTNNSPGQPTAVKYSDFINQVSQNNVDSVTIQTGTVTGKFKIATPYPVNSQTKIVNFQTYEPDGQDTSLVPLLQQHNVTIDAKPADQGNFWVSLLIQLVPIGIIILIIVLVTRRAGQNQQNIFNFGRSRAKLILEDRPSTTFADVAGVDEAKHDLVEIVEFLRTPQKYQRLGGRIPRGVLLVGPPGTGKTLLARAVAGEAQVPFFSMSGSEFVEVLVGVGASRVRDLFDQAKRASPSIIFIDEIDAVGRQRGTSLTTNDEREQTLN